jgi:PAS domain S-box-containing protein
LSFQDDGTIVAGNATLADMLGVAASELVGRTIETLLTTPARIFYQTHFFPLIKLHGRAEEVYMTLRARSGAGVPVLVNAVRHEHEGQARIDGAFIRIREREKYEEELLRAKKTAEMASASKTRFLSMMSHDLRTPLGAIIGYADLLALGIRGEVNEAQKADLTRIRRSSKALLGMLDDLLTVARTQNAQLPMRLEPLIVQRELAEAESVLTPRFMEAGLRYVREECPADLVVRADRDRLQRIVLNLLSNAAKFTPSGGQVSVACSTVADRVLIRVSDTGRGIPEEKLGTVFQPFVQVDSKDASNQGGMGLGLAIGRELARAMGGDIAVESAVGRGSIFTVSLPAAAP